MKVLLVGLERVGKLFSMESLFKKKLTEADMTDVEVVTAEMTEFGSPGGRKLERSMNEVLRDEADFVVVMEPWQKDLLTRFMDYRNWAQNSFCLQISANASLKLICPHVMWILVIGMAMRK